MWDAWGLLLFAGQLWIVSTLLILIALLTVGAYRLWFHPLSPIPGPRLAALSNIWLARHVRDGRVRELAKYLHLVYGPIVRVGPGEVWLDSEEGFRKIYGIGSGYEKSNFYLATALNKPRLDWRLNPHFPDTLDLLSEFDVSRYRMQRRLLGRVYRPHHLKQFEPAVDRVIAHTISELRAIQGGEVDLKMWMHIIAVECLGAVVLSWSPSYIANRSDGGTSTQSYLGWRRKSVFGLFPTITKFSFVSKTLGRAFSNLWGVTFATPKQFKPFFTPVYQRVSKRVTNALRHPVPPHIKRDERKDLLTELINLHKEHPEFTENYLRRMAVTNFGAGHETLCSTLTAAFAMIGCHPEVQRKVAAEVRAFRGARAYDNISLIPYTQASIKESQRLHPVIGLSLSRKVPPGGTTLHGYFLPAGTTVGCNPTALHRNPAIVGPDADTYSPDRWLRKDDPARVSGMERMSLVWGGGGRTCPGRHLAELIVSKVVAALLQEFDMEITAMPREDEMPFSIQSRKVSTVTTNDANDMGGPGGQEHYPESNALRRKFKMNTFFGVAAACSVMAAAKMARLSRDPNAEYVLVHDASKGELDDVKYIKTTELPKKT
ncbi:hypothetical protein VTJ49DRAFT_3013 [Mycothermus thermophilus]|uniref:Cytochrome P450 n=1 Tax=Humicola insolens TaxID=85995 RepID=A0ABR3V8I6_HUMIN